MNEAHHTSQDVRDFIIQNLEKFPGSISKEISNRFGIKRQSVNVHLRKLIEEGVLAAQGNTRNKRYYFKPMADRTYTIELTRLLEEDQVWREKIEGLLKGIRPNILQICHHGFTEMFNNVIDHSEAQNCTVHVIRTIKKIDIDIIDKGIGIFDKIKNGCGLEDQRHAILELAKGKLTTDPARHSGEGIFFTSRMFDKFSILSGELFFTRDSGDDDEWLIEDARNKVKGTSVFLSINTDTNRTSKEVFDRYASAADDYGFTRTHVPVKLAIYGEENLVSRSQARRLLARFDRFKEVFLNFEGINLIGQAFADEIFRVYKNEHPQIEIVWINTNKDVENVILSVLKNRGT